ncbi:MAG: hypothetical protein ACI9DM_002194 [Cyclobacteriaceae bacterium]|jgi:hypothetical protein
MDEIKFKHRWYGDQSIDVFPHDNLSKYIGAYKHHYLRPKIDAQKIRIDAEEGYKGKELTETQQHQLETYKDVSRTKQKEIDHLLEIFELASTCSNLVGHIWQNRKVLEAMEENPTVFLEINEDFNTFVTDCNDCGIADENGLNLEIRKAQLKLIKPSFDKIWSYLQKITFTSSK